MHYTQRLSLQKISPLDAAFIRLLLRSPGWLRFIGDRGVNNEADAVRYIKNTLLPVYEQEGLGMYKLCSRQTNEPMGICGFLKRDFLLHPDLGFALLPEYEGKGFMFEAASSLLAQTNNQPLFQTILAITHPDNKPCQKLLFKLGFAPQGSVQPNANADALLLFGWKKEP